MESILRIIAVISEIIFIGIIIYILPKVAEILKDPTVDLERGAFLRNLLILISVIFLNALWFFIPNLLKSMTSEFNAKTVVFLLVYILLVLITGSFTGYKLIEYKRYN